MVLEAAMQHQSNFKTRTDRMSKQKRAGTLVSGPKSARDVLTEVSHRRGKDGDAVSASRAQVFEDGVDQQTEQESPDVRNIIATVNLVIEDHRSQDDAMQFNLSGMRDTLEEKKLADDVGVVKDVRIEMEASVMDIIRCLQAVEKLSKIDMTQRHPQARVT